MRWVALMPLRGGSKSIPLKNLQLIAGRPLYAWSLAAALEANYFDRIYVASDAAAIRADVSARFGDRVEVIDRAPENASDTASSESVMLEFAAHTNFDVMSLIQATSPLTTAADFRAARARFEAESCDSLYTGVVTKRFFWDSAGQPLNYDPAARPRRQDFAGVIMENGAFYFTRAHLLARTGVRLGGRIGAHVMAPECAAELDEPSDWQEIESLLRRRLAASFDLHVLIVDVDGTLTDGGMYYDATGEAMKKFQTRDAKGMLMLRDSGVRVCVVTAESSKVVAARMRKLGITDYFPGISDKLTWLHDHTREWGIDLAQVGYIGDDLNDLPGLQVAGMSFCPADAVPEVRAAVRYICAAQGGDGAVREVCDLIRAGRKAAAPSAPH